MRRFDPSQCCCRRMERLEAEHWPCEPLDEAMVLLIDVVINKIVPAKPTAAARSSTLSIEMNNISARSMTNRAMKPAAAVNDIEMMCLTGSRLKTWLGRWRRSHAFLSHNGIHPRGEIGFPISAGLMDFCHENFILDCRNIGIIMFRRDQHTAAVHF